MANALNLSGYKTHHMFEFSPTKGGEIHHREWAQFELMSEEERAHIQWDNIFFDPKSNVQYTAVADWPSAAYYKHIYSYYNDKLQFCFQTHSLYITSMLVNVQYIHCMFIKIGS